MKNILVTGSEGFIGKRLVAVLRELEYKVTECDYGIDKPISALTKEELADIDVVVHLAAFINVEESQAKPLDYYENNVGELISLIEKVPFDARFIFTSSAAAKLPTSVYGMTKLIGENIIFDTVQNPVVLRLFNIIEAPNGFINTCVEAKKRGMKVNVYGDCTRDFISVWDILRLILKVIETDEETMFIVPFDVGSGISTPIEEIPHLVGVEYYQQAARTFDIQKSEADITQTEEEFDFKPMYTLKESVEFMMAEEEEII